LDRISLGLILANLGWGATLMTASIVEDVKKAGSNVENPLVIIVAGILLVLGSRRKKR
jgi:hypothetical protein